MKKETISRKAVKDRIKEWMKAHQPWGMSNLDCSEKGPQLKPFLNGKEVEIPIFTDMDEMCAWFDAFEGSWYMRLDSDVDKDDYAEIETLVKDKSTGLPKKKKKIKKPKIWILQSKWRSKEDFKKYPKPFGETEYSEEWFGRAYTLYDSAQGCKLSILNSLRSDFFHKFILGRDWRAFNIETKEAVEFKNIENYYK